MSSRALVTEAETLMRQHQHFDFCFSDKSVYRDARKLIVRSVETDDLLETKKQVNSFMRLFFGRFFGVAAEEFGVDDDDEFAVIESAGETDTEDIPRKNLRRSLLVRKLKDVKNLDLDVPIKDSLMFSNSLIYVLLRLFQVCFIF